MSEEKLIEDITSLIRLHLRLNNIGLNRALLYSRIDEAVRGSLMFPKRFPKANGNN